MFVLKMNLNFFCKGNTCNSKTGESFKVVFNHIKAKKGRITTRISMKRW